MLDVLGDVFGILDNLFDTFSLTLRSDIGRVLYYVHVKPDLLVLDNLFDTFSLTLLSGIRRVLYYVHVKPDLLVLE